MYTNSFEEYAGGFEQRLLKLQEEVSADYMSSLRQITNEIVQEVEKIFSELQPGETPDPASVKDRIGAILQASSDDHAPGWFIEADCDDD